jgi:phosphocarrier protein
MTVSGDSIMGLLMLSAAKGSSIKLRFWGRECESLSLAIRDLIDSHFGEEQ